MPVAVQPGFGERCRRVYDRSVRRVTVSVLAVGQRVPLRPQYTPSRGHGSSALFPGIWYPPVQTHVALACRSLAAVQPREGQGSTDRSRRTASGQDWTSRYSAWTHTWLMTSCVGSVRGTARSLLGLQQPARPARSPVCRRTSSSSKHRCYINAMACCSEARTLGKPEKLQQ